MRQQKRLFALPENNTSCGAKSHFCCLFKSAGFIAKRRATKLHIVKFAEDDHGCGKEAGEISLRCTCTEFVTDVEQKSVTCRPPASGMSAGFAVAVVVRHLAVWHNQIAAFEAAYMATGDAPTIHPKMPRYT